MNDAERIEYLEGKVQGMERLSTSPTARASFLLVGYDPY